MVEEATWKEVRRAIFEGDKYMDNLYREITHEGKTYGVFCYNPGMPLNIVGEKTYCQIFGNLFMTGDALFHGFIECIESGTIYPPISIEEESNTGETWSGKVKFCRYEYFGQADIYIPHDMAEFHVSYQPDSANPKRMKLTIRKEGWYETRGTGDLYLLDKPVMNDLAATPNGTEVNLYTDEFRCFHRNLYSPGIMVPMAYYYWHTRLLRSKALKIAAFLDDYGYKPLSVTSFTKPEEVPANVFCTPEVFGYIPPYTTHTQPKSLGYLADIVDCDFGICRPHFAGLHIPFNATCGVCLYYKLKGWDPCHAGYCYARYTWWDCACKRAIWAMQKYKDPRAKDNAGVSAEDYLLNGWTDGCGKYAPPLISYWQEGKGLWNEKGETYTTSHGWAIIAFTMLGYGYEYTEAKEVADDLVSVALKTQWGYPWTSEYVGDVGCKGPWQSPTGQLNFINRPDLRGSFAAHFIWVDDVPVLRGIKIGEAEKEKEEVLKWNWQPEAPFYIHGGFDESTLPTVWGLRIYEYYKWRVRL